MTKQVKPSKDELLSQQARAYLPITGKRVVSEEDRTVELSFSSDAPIEQWWRTVLILEHTPEACNLARLLSGGPLLFNHHRDKHIGVVVAAHVDADGKARATVKFGRSALAEEKFQDVKDGILCNVSLGFNTDEVKLVEEREDGVDVYRATKWTPFEISLVTIPADTNVGVGRSAPEPEPKPNGERNMPENPAPAAPQPSEADIQKAERDRFETLTRLGDRFNCPEDAKTFIMEGRSVDQFNAFLVERQGKQGNEPTPEDINQPIGLSARELQQYSFLNAIRALVFPNDKKVREAAAFEIEASRAAADATGKEPEGILVPVDVLMASGSRAMNTGTAGANGAALIADTLLPGSFIETLKKKCFIMNIGTKLTGLVGNVSIPKQLADGMAYVVGEEEEPTAADGSLGQIKMNPLTLGARTELTRRFIMQSSIDAENFARQLLATAQAQKLQQLALYADGSGDLPTGVKYLTGVNAVQFATAGKPTFPELVQLETEIAADDADVEGMAYVLNARMRGHCKSTQKMDNTPAMIWETGNTVNGYKAITTNHVADGDVFFGNWADMLIGLWGGLDIIADPFTKSTSGVTRITAFQDFDMTVRHPESFCVGTKTV
ncbi:phage major capsid protein [Halodesulfovibrio aestuarii]|uniref:phage major capsid protein n=1 Tax=Halodesulfovibrio aestuarii TaxID=126333 RepID=UPI003D33957F